MALINCPDCGKEVSDSAKNCIHCGKKLSNKEKTGATLKEFISKNRKILKILIPVVIAVIIIVIVICVINYNSGTEVSRRLADAARATHEDTVEQYNALSEKYDEIDSVYEKQQELEMYNKYY